LTAAGGFEPDYEFKFNASQKFKKDSDDYDDYHDYMKAYIKWRKDMRLTVA
jgi:hypothetical protein